MSPKRMFQGKFKIFLNLNKMKLEHIRIYVMQLKQCLEKFIALSVYVLEMKEVTNNVASTLRN